MYKILEKILSILSFNKKPIMPAGIDAIIKYKNKLIDCLSL